MKKAQASPPPDEEKFTQAFDAWLAARPKAAPTLKTFIASIKPKLAEARRKGVTYEQLVAFLREQGFECSISTLKAYLAVKRRPKAGGKVVNVNKFSVEKPSLQRSKKQSAQTNDSVANPAGASSTPPTSAVQPGIKGGLATDDF